MIYYNCHKCNKDKVRWRCGWMDFICDDCGEINNEYKNKKAVK